MLIDFQGKRIPPNDLTYPIISRAARYGDGLFETLRVEKGKILFLQDHIKRLKTGMKILKMNPGSRLDANNIRSRILKLMKANEFNGNARVRISVFRNAGGGLYTPDSNQASSLIETNKLLPEKIEIRKKGLHIGIYDEHKKPCNTLSRIKSANCLPYILAGIHKQENELDECILLNERGNVCEAITSNVFIVKDGALFTPSLEEGCVEGVFRKQVLKHANKIMPVKETVLTQKAFLGADEIFLTNAIQGIRWVGSIKGKKYFCDYSKKIMELVVSCWLFPARRKATCALAGG